MSAGALGLSQVHSSPVLALPLSAKKMPRLTASLLACDELGLFPRGLLFSPRPHPGQIARRLEAEWARRLQGADPTHTPRDTLSWRLR